MLNNLIVNSQTGLFLEGNQLHEPALVVAHFVKVLPFSTISSFQGQGKYTFKLVLFCKDSATLQKVPSKILACHNSLLSISLSRLKARHNNVYVYIQSIIFSVAARRTSWLSVQLTSAAQLFWFSVACILRKT